MRNLKTLLLTTSFILISLFSFGQDQETITFVSSKSMEGASNVILDLQGNVQTELWNEDYVRIVLEVKTTGLTKEVVRHLASKKRFQIEVNKANSNTLILLNSNMNMPVYINGRELKEDISYKIYIPQNTIVFVTPEMEDISDAIADTNK